jgi:hypothetical protein
MGNATVPVAVIGVPPMASAHRPNNNLVQNGALDLAGGTPANARETRAIPETN